MPEFVKPEFSELSYVKKLLENKNTMDWLGQTIPFPREEWQSFYEKYVEADPKDRYFRLIWCPGCGDYVGMISYFHCQKTGNHEMALLIDSARRMCGYGRSGLRELKKAARSTGISTLHARVPKTDTAWDFLERYDFEREGEDEKFYFELCRL
ncbi:MAG: GNAT family N-acetyltransferase [Solobacterium sp.]|nr:GNAT family N-acetyltransferase [Solobacterium sp.]MBQ9823176.1 GNAT family N-acetyltransferase [Solobacterium sp.]